MNSLKPQYKVALIGAVCLVIMGWMIFFMPGAVTNIEYLGGILFLEGLAAVLWKYQQRFFPALIVTFLMAGTAVPMQAVCSEIRWLVLGAGALVGVAIYVNEHAVSSNYFYQWVAFSCVISAGISAEVSSYPKIPLLKALSLLLLFLYGSFGARATILRREEHFVAGLVWACEALVYFVAVQYFVFHRQFFGNPNSLGAVMAVACVPFLLWGTLAGKNSVAVRRRGFALLLCLGLMFASNSRAAIIAAAAASVILCALSRRYRILIKGSILAVAIAAIVAAVIPVSNSPGTTLTSRYVFKGKEQGSVLASRRPVWDSALHSIEQHPWFGVGFGTTAATAERDGGEAGTFASNATTTKEHGDSYLAILEGVGLIGAAPFVCLLGLTIFKIGATMKRLWLTKDALSPAVPVACVLIAGLTHAMFEDWLFAVGSYLCVFFWILSFMLIDLAPAAAPESSRSKFQPVPSANRGFVFSQSR